MKGGGCCVKQVPTIVQVGGQGRGGGFQGQGVNCGGQSCQPGYQCGAKFVPYRPITSNLTYERITNPNFIFHTCCEARGLPDACLRHCHFNTYTMDKLEAMFHKRDECPIEAANEIHYCAAQGIDHRKCCQISGVSQTSAGNKCLSFCDSRPNRFFNLDTSYLPCLEVFENMKKCFFVEIKKRAEQKFAEKNFIRQFEPKTNDREEF
ncbi:hypothetical protein WR25_00808 [Diploscapter pachys]|uniref:Domain of unknown function DB domain-containing protein n=1 Tax=Diploscapter pachys TaxID=2018661 RepID=A0A2A2JKG6_9BILA|nr:hypothetical protein WR25_00808 [Diploscapter pachys]